MSNTNLIRFLIAGSLQRDFIITSSGKTYFDIPGGSIPYAASGFLIWENGLGLIGQIGENYPQDWLWQLTKNNIDIRGIKILPYSIEARSFVFYIENKRYATDNPIAQFAQLGIPIPKSLLGYIPSSNDKVDKNATNEQFGITHIPIDYLDASSAHICPLDSQSQNLLISSFQKGHLNTISLDADISYIRNSDWETMSQILKNTQIFHISEEKLSLLFRGKEPDLWSMMEELAKYGMEIIIVKRGEKGQYIYDCYSQKRWQIPAYPARIEDVTGCGDAFCGGFLAGYRKSYDPVEAALYGNISASLNIEGIGTNYSLGVLPGLAEARLEKLRGMIKSI